MIEYACLKNWRALFMLSNIGREAFYKESGGFAPFKRGYSDMPEIDCSEMLEPDRSKIHCLDMSEMHRFMEIDPHAPLEVDPRVQSETNPRAPSEIDPRAPSEIHRFDQLEIDILVRRQK